MKIVSVIISEKPNYGNFMLFADEDFGTLIGSGTLKEMRELAVINSNHLGLKIFDRMRGVWINPQPLLEEKPERKQSPHNDSIYTKGWNDFINKHFQG